MITLNLWQKSTWWMGISNNEKIWDEQDRGWTLHFGEGNEPHWASPDDHEEENFIFSDRLSMFRFTVQVPESLVQRCIDWDLYFQFRNTERASEFPEPKPLYDL